ncbi:MAG: hypothetical protein P1P59_03985 [Treponemataceae bacterium]
MQNPKASFLLADIVDSRQGHLVKTVICFWSPWSGEKILYST